VIDRLITLSDKSGEYNKIIHNKNISNENRNILRKNYLKKYPWLSNLTVSTFHGFCYNLFDFKFNFCPECGEALNSKEHKYRELH